jgi:thiol-disulfide isomerase/thioredoxin
MNSRRLIVLGTMLLVALLAGLGFAWHKLASLNLEYMPDVNYTRLDGSKARLAHLKGQVLLVNFWATSCTTCIKEMPKLVEVHQKYQPRGYQTLAVAMQNDPPAYVMNFVESRKLPFIVTMDQFGELAKQFGNVQLTPTSVLINKQGQMVKRYVGEPPFADLELLIEKLLAEST